MCIFPPLDSALCIFMFLGYSLFHLTIPLYQMSVKTQSHDEAGVQKDGFQFLVVFRRNFVFVFFPRPFVSH